MASISQSFQDGLANVFDYIPQIIGALVLLLIGYFVAKIIEFVVRKVLRRLRFDHALHTSPAGRYIIRIMESPTHFVGRLTFWLIFLAFISFAVSALNLPVLTHILNGIYNYLPHIVAAILIFLVASTLSVSGSAFVQRVMGKTPMAKLIATVWPSLVMSIAAFMILNELAIARDIVNITYAAIMGSLALGLALAFGLGGRDVAKHMLDQAYESGRRNSGSVKAELANAKENTKRQARGAHDNMA